MQCPVKHAEKCYCKSLYRKHLGIIANTDTDFDMLLFKECLGVEEAVRFGSCRAIKLSFVDARSLEQPIRDGVKVGYKIIYTHR